MRRAVEKLSGVCANCTTRPDARTNYCSNSARPRRRPGRPIRCWSSTRDEGSAGHIGNIPLRAEQEKLRQARRREGSYLLRSISRAMIPPSVRLYLQLVEVEQAFKELTQNDLSIRPIITSFETRNRSPYFHCVSGLLSAGHAEHSG